MSKLTIVVIRLDRNNRLRNSKPCKDCSDTLRWFGVKQVYYSTGNINTPFLMENL